MSQIISFNNQVEKNIIALSKDEALKQQSCKWMLDGAKYNYVYERDKKLYVKGSNVN